MKHLKQRVPVGFVGNDGRTVEINREFGDDIEKLFASLGGVSAEDVTALLAAISAIQSSITGLATDLAALAARVDKLEGGYQS